VATSAGTPSSCFLFAAGRISGVSKGGSFATVPHWRSRLADIISAHSREGLYPFDNAPIFPLFLSVESPATPLNKFPFLGRRDTRLARRQAFMMSLDIRPTRNAARRDESASQNGKLFLVGPLGRRAVLR
jgi:hypothetical protein